MRSYLKESPGTGVGSPALSRRLLVMGTPFRRRGIGLALAAIDTRIPFDKLPHSGTLRPIRQAQGKPCSGEPSQDAASIYCVTQDAGVLTDPSRAFAVYTWPKNSGGSYHKEV